MNDEKAWLINPVKERRRRKMKKNVKKNSWPDDPAGHRAAALKGWETRKRRRRRRTRHNQWYDDPAGHRAAALKGWRRRRRRSRHNPPLEVMNIAYAAGGFVGTRAAANFILPKLGVESDIARIAVKGGIGLAGYFAISKFINRTAGEYFLVGAAIEGIHDLLKTYVAPSIPALGDEGPLSYSELSAYPELENLSAYAGSELEGSYEELEV